MSFASRSLWLKAALVGLGLCHFASAAPASIPEAAEIVRRQSITTVSATEINSFTPYSFFASAGYCAASKTLTWTCGTNCLANPSFKPVAAGGDGDKVQFWFVGFDPDLNTVVVSHQGTDTSEILPLIEDASIDKTTLSSTLFPGVSSSVEAHSGFAGAQADTANAVLQAVQQAMSTYGTNNIVTTGHSLGAAISLLDALFLPLHIPTAKVSFIGYGLPRVGNQAFANYVDAQPISVTHINNKEDFVPILPGMFLGFHHPSGELHIQDSNAWVACPGQDNSSDQCTVGDVPNIFEGDESNHDGPYNGVEMGC
ncbi:lipase [Trametes versicolor FP-101664 SS1]|uniref:lipase n=1 Tax=Trametes versicolor (strain FP-101664) TaxID=717944 RepID=UPI000462327C|nr:lipase [Trametes versicolor FP-101664 SS1]EIW58094.1 lipase [Trametes versicolor FP-101664 SS1]